MLGSFAFFFFFESRHHIYLCLWKKADRIDLHQNYNTVSKFNEETVNLNELIQYTKYLLCIINTPWKGNTKIKSTTFSRSPKNKCFQLPKTYHFIFFPFICVTFVLVYYITRRKPIHRGIKYWYHHAAGQSLLFSKPIQITVADL